MTNEWWKCLIQNRICNSVILFFNRLNTEGIMCYSPQKTFSRIQYNLFPYETAFFGYSSLFIRAWIKNLPFNWGFCLPVSHGRLHQHLCEVQFQAPCKTQWKNIMYTTENYDYVWKSNRTICTWCSSLSQFCRTALTGDEYQSAAGFL